MTAPMNIVIAGRDAALWLTALAIRRALAPAGVAVIAAELPSALGPADIYPTLPPLEALHRQLGIDEAELLCGTGGCFSLGQNFTDTAGAVPSFFHAYGGAGSFIAGGDFFPYWLKARRFGLSVPLDDFSLTAAAAKQGRLLVPDAETDTYCRADYGYHLPALSYVRNLRALAERAGVSIQPTAMMRPVLDPETGQIAALDLGGRQLAGELFIDTTGPDALLMSSLGGERESWRAHFPAGRMLVAAAPAFAPIPVHAELRATRMGWAALYPAPARTHVVHAYSRSATSDDEAMHDAAAVVGAPLADAVVRASEPGHRPAWQANCVAIGEAACVHDPVHGLGLHAIQLGLVNFLACFPANARYDAQRAEYVRVMRAGFERLRDFQSAHYALARYDGGFWESARNAPQSPPLAHAIATFRVRGAIAPFEAESILPDSWRALFLGHGLMPGSHVPTIGRAAPAEVKEALRRMLAFVRECVGKAPAHDQYLARIMARTNG